MQNNPEQVELNTINELLAHRRYADAWVLLPSIVRLELLSDPPFGSPWDMSLKSVLARLTNEGQISIIEPNVTKDSSCRKT